MDVLAVVLIVCTFLTASAAAQPPQAHAQPARQPGCATVHTPETAATALDLSRRMAGRNFTRGYAPRAPLTIRIKFVRIQPIPTSPTLSDAELDSELAGMNAYFASWGVQFVETEPRQIFTRADDNVNAQRFYDPNSLEDMYDLFNLNTIPGVLNIYFVRSLLSGEYCGAATLPGDPSGQGIVMVNECTMARGNPTTMPHEIGHYFNLEHTHETRHGVECPSGSNCSTAGDLVCDTPADPNLADYSNMGCSLQMMPPPPPGCSATPYAPLANNVMSYAVDELCSTASTPNQRERAIASIYFYRQDLLIPGGDFNQTWINLDAAFPGDGTFLLPYNDFVQALQLAPTDRDFMFLPSSSNFTGRITRPTRLNSLLGPTTIGR